jgi:hypothetical protein
MFSAAPQPAPTAALPAVAPAVAPAPVAAAPAEGIMVFSNEDDSMEECRAAKYAVAATKVSQVSQLSDSIAARLQALAGGRPM